MTSKEEGLESKRARLLEKRSQNARRSTMTPAPQGLIDHDRAAGIVSPSPSSHDRTRQQVDELLAGIKSGRMTPGLGGRMTPGRKLGYGSSMDLRAASRMSSYRDAPHKVPPLPLHDSRAASRMSNLNGETYFKRDVFSPQYERYALSRAQGTPHGPSPVKGLRGPSQRTISGESAQSNGRTPLGLVEAPAVRRTTVDALVQTGAPESTKTEFEIEEARLLVARLEAKKESDREAAEQARIAEAVAAAIERTRLEVRAELKDDEEHSQAYQEDKPANLRQKRLPRDYDPKASLYEDAERHDTSSLVHLCSMSETSTTRRAVTSMEWSHVKSSQCLVAYHRSGEGFNDKAGLALLWDVMHGDGPEFMLQSSSTILSTLFANTNSQIVIGGTYSGQIALWDLRGRSLPVLSSGASAGGHAHPVVGLQPIGSHTGNSIVSASGDGTVCTWSLNMMSQPQDTLQLFNESHPRTDEIGLTCFGFPQGETGNFWVGTDEGAIHQAIRLNKPGMKAGLDSRLEAAYRGHFSAVTGLHFHPASDHFDLSAYFLSCSMDWTVKVWKARPVLAASSPEKRMTRSQDVDQTYNRPLLTLEEDTDYMTDCKWSPSRPGLFGTACASGSFCLYDLSSTKCSVPIAKAHATNANGLNKMSWTRDGRQCALGDFNGEVHMYDINYQPGSDAEPQELHKILSSLADSDVEYL